MMLNFSKTGDRNQKHFMISRIAGMSAKGTFLRYRLYKPSLRTKAYLVDNKAVCVEDIFCYKDYVCQVSKLQHMYVIGLKWKFLLPSLNGKF